MLLEPVDDALNEGLQQVELGARRMAVVEAIGLEIGNSQQMPLVESIVEIDRILDMRLALGWVAHDGLCILERVADVAVEIAAGTDHDIHGIGGTIVKA